MFISQMNLSLSISKARLGGVFTSRYSDRYSSCLSGCFVTLIPLIILLGIVWACAPLLACPSL